MAKHPDLDMTKDKEALIGEIDAYYESLNEKQKTLFCKIMKCVDASGEQFFERIPEYTGDNLEEIIEEIEGYYAAVMYVEHTNKIHGISEQSIQGFLELNYLLTKEFYPETEREEFFGKWQEEFMRYCEKGIRGQLQLNFPEIPITTLAEKYSEMTVRLKGTKEKPEAARNYYLQYFTDEMLNAADDREDWVTFIYENPEAGENDDPTLFDCGTTYEHMKAESDEWFEVLKYYLPDRKITTGNARSRIIQSLLYMQNRLCVKADHSFGKYCQMKFWAIQLLISERAEDGKIPYVFMDGGGGACFGYDSGGGNSVYGYCLIAE